MSTIKSSIYIERPLEEVFEFLSTAKNWLRWHPATLSVSGAITHSARPGEDIFEHIRVGNHLDRVHWKVVEKRRPYYWEFEGKSDSGGSAVIVYRFKKVAGGTRFIREMQYRMPGFLLTLLDFVYLRFLMRRQSMLALSKLKQVLENGFDQGRGVSNDSIFTEPLYSRETVSSL